jgi:hypothetical protein
MDDRGIIACSETEYFAYNPPNSTDRRSIGSFTSIFKLDDPNTSTCFTNISPVGSSNHRYDKFIVFY